MGFDKPKETYEAEQIQVLEGLEAVRKRPGMYIGSTDEKGLMQLFYEVIDNSIDEAMAGFCDLIRVEIGADGYLRVIDNGRGIPVAIHPKMNRPTVEVVLTVLHAGGKFGQEGSAYRVSGGLHGVGVSVVNALSESLEVVIKRNGKIHRQRFQRGVAVQDLEVIGDTTETGTIILFKPDPLIFETVRFDVDLIINRVRELAFLNKGVRIEIYDERTGRHCLFKYDGGIVSFVEQLNKTKNAIHNDVIYFEHQIDDVELEVAIQYTNSYSEGIYSFVNNIHTHEGGTHLSGFRSGLTRTINDYARKNNLLREKEENLAGEDVREGCTAVMSVWLPEPQFEGQTKGKLGNSEVRGVVESALTEKLGIYLEEHPQQARQIIEKALASCRARQAARKARELTRRKNALEVSSLPGKLADCTSTNPDECELYLVEGDSAGGTAKQGRERHFQAIMPLRGKILNVEKARMDRILANAEIRAMITAIGTGIGEDFDLGKLRYGHIVLMTDADVDGAHIRTLLLTFFYRFMKPLITNGHIYIAMPPLYYVKKGKKEEHYLYSDKELDNLLDRIGRDGVAIQRYKGLGEMNAEQLWTTTMNPQTRTIVKLELEDAVAADEIFSTLMGEKVEPRRDFINQHAKEVENLDV